MTANKVAKQIVSNISAFCHGYFDKHIPQCAQAALVRSTITELKEYRPSFYVNGSSVCDSATHAKVYDAQSPKQAQEIADAFATYV